MNQSVEMVDRAEIRDHGRTVTAIAGVLTAFMVFVLGGLVVILALGLLFSVMMIQGTMATPDWLSGSDKMRHSESPSNQDSMDAELGSYFSKATGKRKS